jgi:hypothetical protein
MGIGHGGFHVPVPQQLLDGPDIAGRSRCGAHPNAVLADLICVVPFRIPLLFCSDLPAPGIYRQAGAPGGG